MRPPAGAWRDARRAALALGSGLVLALGPRGAGADSIFSVHGLGEVTSPADMRGRGMGGASVAVPDPWNMSWANPALLARAPGFTLQADLVRESRRIETSDGGTSSPRSTNLPLVRLAVPVPRLGTLGLGLAQFTDVSYEIRSDTLIAGEEATRVLRGKNGLNLLLLTWARRVRPDLEVGVDLDLLLGSYLDIWETEFANPDLVDSGDSLIVNHSRGPILRLGAALEPAPRLHLGGALTFGRAIELRPEIRSTGGDDRRLEADDLDLPLGLAAGVSHDLDRHWRLAGDLAYTRWGGTRLEVGSDPLLDRTAVRTDDVTRFAVGIEYQGDRSGESRRFRAEIPLRAGFAREPWHVRDSFGEKIVDTVFSAGLGLPLRDGAGMIQVATEVVLRGDRELNGASERVFRLGVGFAVRERIPVGPPR